MDLIHLISRRLNLVNYLELRTPTTGNYYGEIQRWRFDTARHFMYNCPDSFDDGLPVDFKIVGCGVAYKAFLDFVLARNDFDYCTVKVDYGCGIIVKNRTIRTERLFQFSDDSALIDNWLAVRNDNQDAFRFFMQNHTKLLRLVGAKTFVRGFNRHSIKLA